MSLFRWGRFRGENKPAVVPGAIWPQLQWQPRGEKRKAASTLTQTDTEYVLTASIAGSGAGDVVVILEDSTLVIQADVERQDATVTFRGTASFWFTLPGEVNAKTLRMMRHQDMVTVYVEKLAIRTGVIPQAALA
jgi:HSP20 family molecular chaperone IbpA